MVPESRGAPPRPRARPGARASAGQKQRRRPSLEDSSAMRRRGRRHSNLVVKADVQGSVEALGIALASSPRTRSRCRCIHSGAGGMTESDVTLAAASKAIIIGFNVRADPRPRRGRGRRRRHPPLHGDLRVVDEHRGRHAGHAQARDRGGRRLAEVRTFRASKSARSPAAWSRTARSRAARRPACVRDDTVDPRQAIGSLRRFQGRRPRGQEGFECGIVLENYNDVTRVTCSRSRDPSRSNDSWKLSLPFGGGRHG